MRLSSSRTARRDAAEPPDAHDRGERTVVPLAEDLLVQPARPRQVGIHILSHPGLHLGSLLITRTRSAERTRGTGTRAAIPRRRSGFPADLARGARDRFGRAPQDRGPARRVSTGAVPAGKGAVLVQLLVG